MSRRGEITVECDCKGCHAEERFTAEQLQDEGLRAAKYAHGWRWFNGKDICPDCDEERKANAAAR